MSGELMKSRTFIILGVITVVTLSIYGSLRASRIFHSQAAASGYRQMFRDRAFMFVVVAAILITFVYYQELLGMPLRVREVGLSNSDFGRENSSSTFLSSH